MDDFSLDDNMGESLGEGLDSSAIGSSGVDAMSLDFLGEAPLQGSNVALDFSDGLASNASISELSGLDDFGHDFSLSGVSDPPPHFSLEEGSSFNGAGSAGSQYGSVSRDISGTSNLFGSVAKFGTSLGSLLAGKGMMPNPAAIGSAVQGGNPNKGSFASISGSHVTLLVVVVVILAGAVLLGGQSNAGR